jgi:heme-degrading monooxygenase HmoA
MGKSVLLTALDRIFEQDESVKSVLLLEKAQDYSVRGCTEQLAEKLGLPEVPPSVTQLLRAWFEDDGRQLVLLYDEIDHYVDKTSTIARDYFNALASAHSTFPDQLGIIVAGGLGVYELEAEIGSDYTNSAPARHLEPFDRQQLATLTSPFVEDGRALDKEILDSIYVFSGGNPRIVTYILHHCWEEQEEIGTGTVFDIVQKFQSELTPFKRAVYRGLGIENHSSNTNRVWNYIDEHPGPYMRSELLAKTRVPELSLDTSIELLRASGLIRIQGRIDAEYLDAAGVPSMLRPLPTPHRTSEDRNELFDRDMQRALGRIGRWGLDFFRDKEKSALVPECVFAAFLAGQFAEAGWHVDREAMQGPGFTDIKMYHPRFRDDPDAVIEVKLWGNREKKAAHRQATDYHNEGKAANQCMAVVVIASLTMRSEEIAKQYQESCLADIEYQEFEVEGGITAGFLATRKDGEGAGIPVRHYLLNLRRRRR